MYETAIVLPLVLLMLVTTIRTGIVAYDQLQTDATAMTYARYSALNIANPDTQTKSLFPSSGSYTYATPFVTAAPAASPAIDWNQKIPAVTGPSNMDSANRHGGQSVMVPAGLETLVSTQPIKVFFGRYQKQVKITGSDVEPLFLECGHHWMVGQAFLNANQGTSCSANQDPTQYVSFFLKGENTPPYYMSQRYLVICDDKTNIRQDMDYTNANNNPTVGWNSCDPTALRTVALGNASYLHVHNWYRTATGWQGTAVSISSAPVFREIACHQRFYTAIANSIVDYDNAHYVGATMTAPEVKRFLNWSPTLAKSFVTVVRAWDAISPAPPGVIPAVDTDTNDAFNPMTNCSPSTYTFQDGVTTVPDP